jgi:hypothetical protein
MANFNIKLNDTVINLKDSSIGSTFYNNKLLSNQNKVNNTSKNITIRLDTFAIRNNKFDFASFKFDNNFPEINIYSFCGQNLSTVFKSNKNFIAKNYQQNKVYPPVDSLKIVKNFNPNNCTNNEGTTLCYSEEETEILSDLSGNYDTTIYGYAFYVDTLRDVEIPNIGNIPVLCGGGHFCCRTEFTPTLLMGDNVIVANTIINLNNLENCEQSTTNVPGFVDLTGYERSSSFQFNGINPALLATSRFLLSCNLQDCHNSVTMVVLVIKNLATNEYEIILNTCVPACLEVDIGTIKIPAGTPVPCNSQPGEDCEPPPPNCNYLDKTYAVITFDDLSIPIEALGSQELKDQIDDIANATVIMPLLVSENGISADPILMGTVSGSIQILAYFSALNDGLGNLNIQIGLNVLQTASAYPFLYALNFIGSIVLDDACSFNKLNGQTSTGNGISLPSYTGNGFESVFVNIF